jgi:hypothetical protein
LKVLNVTKQRAKADHIEEFSFMCLNVHSGRHCGRTDGDNSEASNSLFKRETEPDSWSENKFTKYVLLVLIFKCNKNDQNYK